MSAEFLGLGHDTTFRDVEPGAIQIEQPALTVNSMVLFDTMLELVGTHETGHPMGGYITWRSQSTLYQLPSQQGSDITRAWIECHPQLENALHVLTQRGDKNQTPKTFEPSEEEIVHLTIIRPRHDILSPHHGGLSNAATAKLLLCAGATVSLIQNVVNDPHNIDLLNRQGDTQFDRKYRDRFAFEADQQRYLERQIQMASYGLSI